MSDNLRDEDDAPATDDRSGTLLWGIVCLAGFLVVIYRLFTPNDGSPFDLAVGIALAVIAGWWAWRAFRTYFAKR